MEPPSLLVAGAQEALEELEQTTREDGRRLVDGHAQLFAEFRRDLRDLFTRHSYWPSPAAEMRPQDLRARWDGVRSSVLKGEIAELFGTLLRTIEVTDSELFAEELTAAADEGFDRTLWLLAMAGIDITPYWSATPREEDWAQLLPEDGIHGGGWEARLGVWGLDTTDKLRRGLTAAMVSEATWEETGAGVDRILQGHSQHVTGLFGNEMFRAFTLGALLATVLVERDVPMVRIWVSRGDDRVCPLCNALHLTATHLRPIDDSHPGCRCFVVTVPEGYVPTPIPYPSFSRP